MEKEKSNTRDRELSITKRLDAPVEMVWDLWTKPEHIVNWWDPAGFTTTINTMDVTPGGQWLLVMHGPGITHLKQTRMQLRKVPLFKN